MFDEERVDETGPRTKAYLGSSASKGLFFSEFSFSLFASGLAASAALLFAVADALGGGEVPAGTFDVDVLPRGTFFYIKKSENTIYT